MVEAAVVFPLVIFVVMVLIYGMIFLFDEAASSSAVRRAVIREAQSASGAVTLYQPEGPAVSAYTDVYRVRPCAAAQQEALFRGHMPGIAARQRTVAAHQYIFNEKTEIRLWDLFQ